MMKSFFLAGALALTGATAMAFPAVEAVAETVTRNVLTWTGPVVVGGSNVTLSGSAKSIHEQILEINPNYDSELGHKRAGRAPTHLERLADRSLIISPTSSDYTCVYGTAVDVSLIAEGIKDLYAIGSGQCTASGGSVGNGGCTRVSCYSSAGIWLCNDASTSLSIDCRLVADNAVEVLIQCQDVSYSGNTWSYSVHGQIFSSNRVWNTIVNVDTAGC